MPPPTREMFHNGPPNSFPPPGRGGNFHQPQGFNSNINPNLPPYGPGPVPGRHNLPPPQGIPRGSHGHGSAPYPPNRPGPPGPRGDRWQSHTKPAHLPKKPVNPLGDIRGGPPDGPGPPRGRGEPSHGGGELNYG